MFAKCLPTGLHKIFVYFNSTTLTFIEKVLKLKYEARI